jgi:hypothetical protein
MATRGEPKETKHHALRHILLGEPKRHQHPWITSNVSTISPSLAFLEKKESSHILNQYFSNARER